MSQFVHVNQNAALLPNQDPILGWLGVASVGALAIFLLVRKGRAEEARCRPTTPERLQLYHEAFGVALVSFPEATEPPPAIVTNDNRISIPQSTDQRSLEQPAIVIISGDRFFKYTGVPGQPARIEPAPQEKEDYCALIRDRERI